MSKRPCWTANRLDAVIYRRDSTRVNTYASRTKRSILHRSDRRFVPIKATPLDAAALRLSQSKAWSDIGHDGLGVVDAAALTSSRCGIGHASARSDERSTASSASSARAHRCAASVAPLGSPRPAESARLSLRIDRVFMKPI